MLFYAKKIWYDYFMKNIIIIDMQNGFMCDKNKFLIEKIENYLKVNHFDNIFLTKCINDDSSPYTNILKWNGVKSLDEQQFAISIPKGAKILAKNGYGISFDNIQILKDMGINEIEICGTDIDACVLAIGFNLFDNNIKPIFIKDLCATSSKNSSITEYAYTIIKRQFGNDSLK